MNNSIVAVVVTYNRFNLLQKCILALRDQTYKLDAIIVVNNGSYDDTPQWLSNQLDLIVINQQNLGGAGGFYRGIKEAYEMGFDWIWVMDDDAFADINAVNELVLSIERHNYDKNICYWSNPNLDSKFLTNEKRITDDQVMFVGFAISSNAVKTVGLPRADFFIYRDDSEYSIRLLNSNFVIIKLRDSIIEHGTYYINEVYVKKIFGVKISFPKMSDMKVFYYFRNYLLMYRILSFNWIKALVFCFVGLIKVLLLTNQTKISIIAIYHGIIRKSGKYNFKILN